MSDPIRNALDIHDLVDDLTTSRNHRERYTVREHGTTWIRGHDTRVPSLIAQLRLGVQVTTGEGGAGGYASRPAAQLEALDTLAYIDREAARWVRDLGEDDPTDTEACIRKLHGLHASASRCARARPTRSTEVQEYVDGEGRRRERPTSVVRCCSQHAIETDVRRWWTQARIATGWDSAAWRPDNTCPVCDKRGTLRVRLSAHSGLCISCRETWDDSTIGLLADHIRRENLDELDQTAT